VTDFPDLDRRSVIAAALASGLTSGSALAAPVSRPIRALAFDAFTIFDARALTTACVATFGERGSALAAAWTNKLFALSWLETSAGRYSGFAALADAALESSALSLGIEHSPAQRRDVVATFDHLPIWPDAVATLVHLRSRGIRLAFLSNLGAATLMKNMQRHGLDRIMDRPLSTDLARAYKPSPRAYALGPKHFGLPKEQIGFVAFGGWDALGAKWFGYPTAWINRAKAPAETLLPAPDVQGFDLTAALQLVETGAHYNHDQD
jgi:2-haloacid dehalogenase